MSDWREQHRREEQNLSAKGMLLEAGQRLEKGQKVELSFHIQTKIRNAGKLPVNPAHDTSQAHLGLGIW